MLPDSAYFRYGSWGHQKVDMSTRYKADQYTCREAVTGITYAMIDPIAPIPTAGNSLEIVASRFVSDERTWDNASGNSADSVRRRIPDSPSVYYWACGNCTSNH